MKQSERASRFIWEPDDITVLGNPFDLIDEINEEEERKQLEAYVTDLAHKAGIRVVRTAAGARKYGQPIGTVIRLDAPEIPKPRKPKDSSTTSAAKKGRSSGTKYPGMKPASDADRKAFKEATGKSIPPAWTDVWIADDLLTAKVLARGKDSKGRAQTLYSQAHTASQAEAKFARIKRLQPHLKKLDAALERDAMTNDSAAALLLIRRMGMRPGSDRDTGADKKAHGATNLLAKHVKVTTRGKVKFDFTGKKGVHIQLEVEDPQIAKVIGERLKRKKGNDRLFDTDENKVREYMQSTGVPSGYLLKDLRTVHANVVALRTIKEFAALGYVQPETKTEFRRWRKEVAEYVSAELGNTPTLALSSYINPTVFTPWVKDESWL